MENTSVPEQVDSLPGDLLTVEEVAVLLKMHPGSVRRLIQQGRLPAKKMGYKMTRVLRSSVAAILLDHDANAMDGTAGTGHSAELLRRAAVALRLAREVIANDPDDPFRYTNGYEDLAGEMEKIAGRWGSRNIPGEVQLKVERSVERLRQLHAAPPPADTESGEDDK